MGNVDNMKGVPMLICNIANCKGQAVTIMEWPTNDRQPILLCESDARFYRSIAGKHMQFSDMTFDDIGPSESGDVGGEPWRKDQT